MIIKCTQKDNAEVMGYLNKDRVFNLFIVGDIENFGYDSDFQDVYMDKDDNGICAIYLNYRGSIVLCSYKHKLDKSFIKELFDEHGAKSISGSKELIDSLGFENINRNDCYFAKMTKKNRSVDTSEVKLLTVDDLEGYNCVNKIVFNTEITKEQFEKDVESKAGRRYGIYEGNKLVCSATSTAECEGLAMVVGVGTLEEYRGKGYASKVISKLSNDLLDEGKTPCLFYNNPAAGRIYKALGYEDIGEWTMAGKPK